MRDFDELFCGLLYGIVVAVWCFLFVYVFVCVCKLLWVYVGMKRGGSEELLTSQVSVM